jgi:hypothetical protein
MLIQVGVKRCHAALRRTQQKEGGIPELAPGLPLVRHGPIGGSERQIINTAGKLSLRFR